MTDHDPLGIAGELINEKYRIEHLVGEGGFAVVYRARHVIWDRPVAVKLFSGLSSAPSEYREALQQQFVQEGALLTELSVQTSGIVQARDVGFYTTPRGQWVPYIVLEWLDGSSLEAILEQDQRQGLPWTEGEVVGFLKRILAPLEVAHRHGVTHRDIKPANIFVLGSAARSPITPCKLLDFGVAKMVADHSTLSAALAKTGLAVTSFTPQYGAPEQFTRSYGATGPWTDVYAVALVASEMLVGRAALEGEDLVQLGFASGNPDRRPTPRALGARISDPLEAVFTKALAVHPQDRFADAGEFLRSTLAAAGELGTSAPTERRSVPTPSVAPGRPSPAPASTPPAPPEERSPETQGAAANTIEPRPPAPSGEGGFGVTLVLLVVLVSSTLVYSATGLPGARETRRVLAAMAHDVRRMAQGLSSKETRSPSASPLGASTVASPEDTRDASSLECPPHTWRLSLSASKAQSLAASPPLLDAGAPAPVRCIDEAAVSERDYESCTGCARPKTSGAKAHPKAPTQSQFCVSGASPTDEPIRCVTWKQATTFCRLRSAELPTREELMAIGRASATQGAKSPGEWDSKRPSGPAAALREFRCATSR